MSIDATFLGYQKWNNVQLFALYTVNKPDHPLHMSTVSIATLIKNGLTFEKPPEKEDAK